MKALILAAGLGTRLRPLTNNIPKVLVPIGRKPLLAYHFDSLSKFGINDILINTHYLPGQVRKFVKNYIKHQPKIHIKITFEETLLGSAGTLKKNQNFFKGENHFLVIYGDNFTNINYQKLLKLHLAKKGVCTIACYWENQPETKGIIIFDKMKQITKFIEKPKTEQITTNYANAGIYIFNKKIFNYLNKLNYSPLDFGYHIFPYLLTNQQLLFAYLMKEFFIDIGTKETYDFAQKKVGQLKF